jgi:hypothetical protein
MMLNTTTPAIAPIARARSFAFRGGVFHALATGSFCAVSLTAG